MSLADPIQETRVILYDLIDQQDMSNIDLTLDKSLLKKQGKAVNRQLKQFVDILDECIPPTSSEEDTEAERVILSSSVIKHRGGGRRFYYEDTLLIRTIKNNRLRMAEMLIEKGVDVNAQTNGAGFTALHMAVKMAFRKQFFDLLLRSGADPNIQTKITKNRGFVCGGDTPLIWAIKHKRNALVDNLLFVPSRSAPYQTADPNLPSESEENAHGKRHTKMTPLIWAIKCDNKSAVELLLRHKNTDVNLPDKTIKISPKGLVNRYTPGWSPLTWAAYCGSSEIIFRFLLEKMGEAARTEYTEALASDEAWTSSKSFKHVYRKYSEAETLIEVTPIIIGGILKKSLAIAKYRKRESIEALLNDVIERNFPGLSTDD